MRIFVIGGSQRLCLAFRRTLTQEPEFRIVGEAAAANAGVDDCPARVAQMRPDLVLLDWDLPDRQALGVLHTLDSVDDPPKVVVFGLNQAACREACRSGAITFVCRGDPIEQLLGVMLGLGQLSPGLLD